MEDEIEKKTFTLIKGRKLCEILGLAFVEGGDGYQVQKSTSGIGYTNLEFLITRNKECVLSIKSNQTPSQQKPKLIISDGFFLSPRNMTLLNATLLESLLTQFECYIWEENSTPASLFHPSNQVKTLSEFTLRQKKLFPAAKEGVQVVISRTLDNYRVIDTGLFAQLLTACRGNEHHSREIVESFDVRVPLRMPATCLDIDAIPLDDLRLWESLAASKAFTQLKATYPLSAQLCHQIKTYFPHITSLSLHIEFKEESTQIMLPEHITKLSFDGSMKSGNTKNISFVQNHTLQELSICNDTIALNTLNVRNLSVLTKLDLSKCRMKQLNFAPEQQISELSLPEAANLKCIITKLNAASLLSLKGMKKRKYYEINFVTEQGKDILDTEDWINEYSSLQHIQATSQFLPSLTLSSKIKTLDWKLDNDDKKTSTLTTIGKGPFALTHLKIDLGYNPVQLKMNGLLHPKDVPALESVCIESYRKTDLLSHLFGIKSGVPFPIFPSVTHCNVHNLPDFLSLDDLAIIFPNLQHLSIGQYVAKDSLLSLPNWPYLESLTLKGLENVESIQCQNAPLLKTFKTENSFKTIDLSHNSKLTALSLTDFGSAQKLLLPKTNHVLTYQGRWNDKTEPSQLYLPGDTNPISYDPDRHGRGPYYLPADPALAAEKKWNVETKCTHYKVKSDSFITNEPITYINIIKNLTFTLSPQSPLVALKAEAINPALLTWAENSAAGKYLQIISDSRRYWKGLEIWVI
jgi:hypothetical protein